jgi:hypothetical protein
LLQEDREYRDFIAILLDFKGIHDRYILGHRIYGAQEDAFIEVCETYFPAETPYILLLPIYRLIGR